MKYFSFFIIFISLFSCEQCPCKVDENILQTNDSLLTGSFRDNRVQQHAAEYWRSFDEPVLYTQETEAYRLSINFTFPNYFKIYRFQRTEDAYELILKEYAVDNFSSGREDSLVSSQSKEISAEEWNDFVSKINNRCFWTIPITDYVRGLDGDQWRMEGYNPKGNSCTSANFRIIARWSPMLKSSHDCSDFLSLCDAFFEFDSLDIKQF